MSNILTVPVFLLIISTIFTIIMFIYVVRIKTKTPLQIVFCYDIIFAFFISLGVLFQNIFSNTTINPYEFEKITYIGTCLIPVSIFLTGLIFYKENKFTLKLYYTLLLFIPFISIICVWTDNHLFYKNYSMDYTKATLGPQLYIHCAYTYLLLLSSLVLILKSIKSNIKANIKARTLQAILIVIGMFIPILVNILFTLKLISVQTYITPISFTLTLIFFAIAIFKFQFMGVAPIALRKIVNRISDSFIVLNTENQIADFNRTFYNTFKIHKNKKIITLDFLEFLERNDLYFNYNKIQEDIEIVKKTRGSKSFELYIRKLKKYFITEVTAITKDKQLLGILILFKDITQHKKDIETIKNNQSILMEKERLATLGAMIGGVAHNLKTPIMSISGATEGLEDLVHEYENSVGDPDVTIDDHHAIAKDMMDWVTKIRSYDTYMSDIITAVKGQAVNMNDSQEDKFTIEELLSRINILMKHELKEGQVALNEDVSIDKTTEFSGNVNSLVQVINNLISNAIQAYPPIDSSKIINATGSSYIKGNGSENGSGKAIGQKITNIKTSRTIDLIISENNDNIFIKVVDYASGIPENIKNKLFKEMITTKGHNGSGLGLFMSYSTIKGNFHGDMTFTSELNKGTTFLITLPRKTKV